MYIKYELYRAKNQELFNGTEINKLNDQIKKLTNDDLKTAKDSSKQAEVDTLDVMAEMDDYYYI